MPEQSEVDETSTATDEVEPDEQPLPRSRTRRRVTAAELEARFDSWREDRTIRREQRDPAQRSAWGRTTLGIAMVAVLGGVSLFGGLNDDARDRRIEEQDQTIGGLEAALRVLNATVDVGISDDLVRLVEMAATDAEAVADAQHRYAELAYQAHSEDSAGEGAPTVSTLAMAEHRRTLAEYFDPSTWLVDGENAYQWSTDSQFDNLREIDPRFEWYIRYDGMNPAASSTYQWQVESVTPRLPTGSNPEVTTAQVVWTCIDTATDEVLAWAEAEYTLLDAGEDEQADMASTSAPFTEMTLVLTAAGAADQAPVLRDVPSIQIPTLDDVDDTEESS